MSSAGISFGGLASGLDTKAIISALVAVERRPISALQTKKSGYSQQKSLFGDLGGLLDKLSTAAKAIKSSSDLLAYKATSSDETLLRASANSTATPGTHTLRVLQLAQAQVSHSAGVASATTQVGNGAAGLIIQSGTNTTVVGVGSNPTPQSIAAAINAEDDAHSIGVRAEVVDTGSTNNRYQLVLRSTKVGSAGQFTISVDEGDTSFQQFVAGITTPVPGQDAQVLLTGSQGGNSGITITRPSNEITDLWQGVTVDLVAANTNKDVTITVTSNTDDTAKKVQAFVDAYNKVVDFAVAQNALGADGKAQNPLFGDSTLRSLRTNLRSSVNAVVGDTGNQAYQMLAQVGITADRDGHLTFDRSKFDTTVAADQTAVAKLFTNTNTGIVNRLLTQVDAYTGTSGLLQSRTDGLTRMVKDTQSRIDVAETRLTSYQKQLETKYANLETLLTRLNSQGSSVSNIRR